VRRWIGLALVGLFVGLLWPVYGTIEAKGATTPTSYTIYVHPYYVDTQQYGSGITVTLKDITTGATVGKISDNSGTVQFNIPGDLNGNYNDGDDLVLELEAPSDYQGSPMLIYGDPIWDGKHISLCMYRRYVGTSYVGYMYGSNGNGGGQLSSPQTVYFGLSSTTYTFKATWTHSDSRPGTHIMKFNLVCYKRCWDSINKQYYYGEIYNVSMQSTIINNPPPGCNDPELSVTIHKNYLNEGPGRYAFKMIIYNLDTGQKVWDSGRSGDWVVV